MRISEIAATIHADMCDDERNGYSWSPRWGGDSPYGSKTLTIDGKQYTYRLGSYDCSSSVITAWRLALQYTQYAGALDDAYYTGNMRSVFAASGLFEVWDTSSTCAVRGDVYLNDANHTAMCQDGGGDGVYGYDAMSEFSINEYGEVYGGQVGDQTGWESHITGYSDYPWNCTLHYNGKADGTEPAPSPAPAPTVTWRVRQGGLWRREGFAGVKGKPITAIAIDFHGCGWYQVCTEQSGWLDPVRGYDIRDADDGYAGWNDSPVIAVRCYYETPNPSQTGWLAAKYRVSDVGADWYPYQYDDDSWNGQDGYAGDMRRIDRFQIELA